MKLSLGFILAISLAGLQFLAIITVVFTSYLTSERAMLQHARGLVLEAGENASEHSKGFLSPARTAADLFSRIFSSGLVASDDFEAMEKMFFQALLDQDQISGMYYGDEAGNFVFVMQSEGPGALRTKFVETNGESRSTRLIWRDTHFGIVEQKPDPEDKFDPRLRPWYQTVRTEQTTIWTDPYIFFSSQQPGITVAAPVVTNGVFRGVIGVDVEISTISNFLSLLDISENGTALILNENGDVIAHPNLDEIVVRKEDGTAGLPSISKIEDQVARGAFANIAQSGVVEIKSNVQSEFRYMKDTYLSLLMPIVVDDLPLTIAIYAPENDFIQVIKDNRLRNIWIAAVISLVTACAGLALAELILRPVRAFAVRAALVSQGEVYSAEPLPGTYRELEQANKTLIREIAQRRQADVKIQELNRDLSHFSRVNLMGQMATGLAHELSQPLTAITQNVDAAITTAKDMEGDSEELLSILSELDDQAHRGGDILRALRGFVRRDQGNQKPFDFNELLRQTHRLMHHEAEEHNIDLIFDVPGSPVVIANRVQIAQVLVNLIRNAIEALATTKGKKREIRISAIKNENRLDVCVDDTGPGVDQDVTLFKQFETSKKEGMGLGLSICRTIMEANGGRLYYDAEHTAATRFRMSLRI